MGRDVLPFDFIACDQGRTSFVRVRRLWYAGYEVADIGFSCRDDIAALRAMPVLPGISLQLHVRGPDRHWHRYLVLPMKLLRPGNRSRSHAVLIMTEWLQGRPGIQQSIKSCRKGIPARFLHILVGFHFPFIFSEFVNVNRAKLYIQSNAISELYIVCLHRRAVLI
jgi:hypothetical protein